jgi:hypothetical protein
MLTGISNSQQMLPFISTHVTIMCNLSVFCFVTGIHYGVNAAASAANVFSCIDKIFLENWTRKNKDKVVFV